MEAYGIYSHMYMILALAAACVCIHFSISLLHESHLFACLVMIGRVGLRASWVAWFPVSQWLLLTPCLGSRSGCEPYKSFTSLCINVSIHVS